MHSQKGITYKSTELATDFGTNYIWPKCLPEMKTIIYSLWMVLKDDCSIVGAECGCPAGKGPAASCKHIAALCYSLDKLSHSAQIPQLLSPTNQLQTWNKISALGKGQNWTVKMVCLSNHNANWVPCTVGERETLVQAGLGKKKVNIQDISCSPQEFRDIVVAAFPKLNGCGGFDLLRCIPNTKNLKAIFIGSFTVPQAPEKCGRWWESFHSPNSTGLGSGSRQATDRLSWGLCNINNQHTYKLVSNNNDRTCRLWRSASTARGMCPCKACGSMCRGAGLKGKVC